MFIFLLGLDKEVRPLFAYSVHASFGSTYLVQRVIKGGGCLLHVLDISWIFYVLRYANLLIVPLRHFGFLLGT